MPWLSLEGPCQSLTNTEADANNQLLDWAWRPNGRAGGWSRGAEGAYSPMGRTMISATQMPQDSQGLNNQPRGTHGSSQKCGRGRPCWASVGGMVLGQVKAQQRPEQRENEVGRRECVGWRGRGKEEGEGLGLLWEGVYRKRFYHWQCK